MDLGICILLPGVVLNCWQFDVVIILRHCLFMALSGVVLLRCQVLVLVCAAFKVCKCAYSSLTMAVSNVVSRTVDGAIFT